MRRAALITLSALTAVASATSSLAAQQRANAPAPDAVFPRTPEDTGWTVPHTFARYATPAECAASVRWNESEYWSNKRWDTVYHQPRGDALQEASKAVVAACAARFSAGNTVQRELMGLARAKLAAGDDAATVAAVTRFIAASGREKPWALRQVVDLYLAAAPPRVQDAERYLGMLDALGAGAAPERLMAHSQLAAVAAFCDSLPLQAREITAAFAAMDELAGDARREYARASAEVYMQLAQLRARQNEPAAAMAAVTAGRARIVPLRPSMAMYFRTTPYQSLGKAAPKIRGSSWFNVPQGDTIFPRANRPTLVVFSARGCGGNCYANHAVLRRLAGLYRGSGLDIVLVENTIGYDRGKLVPIDSEPSIVQQYYKEYLGFEFPLAVWKVRTTKRDDGRLIPESYPNHENYQPPVESLPGVLIDKVGTIRLVENIASENEAALRRVIASLLQ